MDLRAKPGLTLIELVIVMVIIAMVLGGVVGMMRYSSDEYALKKAARELEALSKRARSAAILKQTPYALEFKQGMVRLMPLAEAMGQEDMEAQDLERGFGEEEIKASDAVRWELSLDNGMQASMQRWQSEEWIQINENEVQIWRFDPDGLCEPIAMELWLEGGRVAMDFNPLTGAINTTTYETR